MKKTLFILAIALCGAGVLSAQHMKGFVSAGVSGGIDASFGMPVAGPNTDGTLTLEVPYSHLDTIIVDTTVLGGTNYDDGYFVFNPVKTSDGGTHKQYFKMKDARNLDVIYTLNLTVLPCGPGENVSDGTYTYETVPVAGYCWTKQNLRTAATGAVPYDNDPANEAIYGLLYPWKVAAGVAASEEDTTQNEKGYVQGICPTDWHLPTEEEFGAFNAQNINTHDLNATTLWVGPYASENTNATGFTALPAGRYNSNLGRFEGIGTETSWWTTTYSKPGSNIVTAKVFSCAYYCEKTLESEFPINDKVSVRCVRTY